MRHKRLAPDHLLVAGQRDRGPTATGLLLLYLFAGLGTVGFWIVAGLAVAFGIGLFYAEFISYGLPG